MKQKRKRVRKTSGVKMKRQATNSRMQGSQLPKYLFLDTETICPKCRKTMMISSVGELLLTSGTKVVECKSCDSKVNITVE